MQSSNFVTSFFWHLPTSSYLLRVQLLRFFRRRGAAAPSSPSSPWRLPTREIPNQTCLTYTCVNININNYIHRGICMHIEHPVIFLSVHHISLHHRRLLRCIPCIGDSDGDEARLWSIFFGEPSSQPQPAQVQFEASPCYSNVECAKPPRLTCRMSFCPMAFMSCCRKLPRSPARQSCDRSRSLARRIWNGICFSLPQFGCLAVALKKHMLCIGEC